MEEVVGGVWRTYDLIDLLQTGVLVKFSLYIERAVALAAIYADSLDGQDHFH